MADVINFIQNNPGAWGLIIVAVAAALEYWVPLLPADSVVLAGSLLVVAGSHHFATVATAAVLGGIAGTLGHFYLGRWLGRHGTPKWLQRWITPAALEKFFVAFRRHGMWVLALNRALPGVRAITFLAAGLAGLPLLRTMFFGLISNIGWTCLILSVGVLVGGSWEKIEAAFTVYQRAVYGLAVLAVVIFFLVRMRRRRASGDSR